MPGLRFAAPVFLQRVLEMNLLIAIASNACAAVMLYFGTKNSDWIQLGVAAVCLTVGREYIKRYKLENRQ